MWPVGPCLGYATEVERKCRHRAVRPVAPHRLILRSAHAHRRRFRLGLEERITRRPQCIPYKAPDPTHECKTRHRDAGCIARRCSKPRSADRIARCGGQWLPPRPIRTVRSIPHVDQRLSCPPPPPPSDGTGRGAPCASAPARTAKPPRKRGERPRDRGGTVAVASHSRPPTVTPGLPSAFRSAFSFGTDPLQG